MNKKFTKLMAALALLTFLAVPLGMWGQSIEINTENFTKPNSGSGYAAYDGTRTIGGVDITSSNVMVQSGNLQFKKSSGYLYNSTAMPGNITKITLATATNFTIYVSTTANTETQSVTSGSAISGNYTYFKVKTGSSTGTTASITIEYSTGGSTTYTVTYDCNGGTSGCPENVTGIEPDDEITLADAPSKTGHAFDGWNDGTSTYDAGDPYTVTENVTMTAQWTAYTITAQSNNASYGTVSLDGFTITASPASGCRVKTTNPYTVDPANSATVAQSGNTFAVTPTANTTVTINFEEIPTHAAIFSVNGTTTSTQVAEGAAITFPSNPAAIDEMVFMGWTNAAIDGTQSTAPTYVTSATMGNSDVTFYAVFASVTPGTATTVTDELTRETTGVTSGTTTYSSWSGKKSISDAVYAGHSAGGNNSIQLRTNNNNSGVVTTASGGKAKKVTITWNSNTSNGRILDIYGKNSAYSAATDLYNSNNQGTKLGSVNYGTSTELSITGDYQFIGMRSSDGAMYITSISIEWESISPDTYSDYCTTVIIPTVAKPTFSQASGEVVDGTVVTMSCTTEGATIYYSTDDGATWTEGNTYTVHENVTLKAKAVNGSDESQVVEAIYTVQYILTIDMEHVEYFIFNYHDETWDDFLVDAEGRPLVHAGDNVRVSVASVEDCYTLQGLSVTFGENTIVPEYLSESGEYSFIMPASSATLSASVNSSMVYTLTVEGLEYASFEQLRVGSGSEEVDLDNNHQATICEQLHVAMVGLTVEYGHVLESVTLTYGGQTTEITPESGVYEFTMPSSNATLTITTHEAALFTYTKVTSVTPGKRYIIVTSSSHTVEGFYYTYYAMGGKSANGSYMNRVEVSVDNNTVTVAENEGVAEILIDGTEDHYTLHTSEGYLVGGNKSMNTNGTDESIWGISFNENGEAIIAWNNESYVIEYNSQFPRFACYGSTQAKVCLYEKNEYDLTINGYGSSTTEGWNLIASPVSTTPDQVTNMLTDETTAPYSYDLYRFNQAAESEWENYHQHSGDFNIVPGKGYLYANKGNVNNTPNTVTLTFTGVPYSGDGEIELVYNTANSDSKMHGWNLVGNPFDVDAEINDDYYMMNEEGSELIANDDRIVEAMQGVFVQAESEGETVIFAPQSRAKSNDNDNKVVINISRNRGIIVDRAVVRFGEGRQLPKMQLFEGSTKLYITQDNKDYAVVRTEAQGEMPVNFKAAENGTYTLTVNPEGVEMNYLHLIDNMTGNDVDLLATPSYTFNATTRDYESRFRLVFAANNEDGVSAGSTAFAFYSNGTWVINNIGEATLQVVDVNGRILSSETVNGSVSKAINAPAGVYMLRLINGNDVKTQKIVVR